MCSTCCVLGPTCTCRKRATCYECYGATCRTCYVLRAMCTCHGRRANVRRAQRATCSTCDVLNVRGTQRARYSTCEVLNVRGTQRARDAKCTWHVHLARSTQHVQHVAP